MIRRFAIIIIMLLLVPFASALKIPTASVDRYVSFVAVDATDFITRETGLTSFTVYYYLDDAAATTMTTPTTAEPDSTNMPGCYRLLIDESGMTTLAAGHDTEELTLHVTHASMAPVTRAIEIYRLDTTEGQTITVASGNARAVDSSGNAIAPATTALSTATWTGTKAGYIDAAISAVPTVTEFNARSMPTADYFLFGSDSVTVGNPNDCKAAGFSTHSAADVWNLDVSAYAGVGYAGTYLKTLHANQSNWTTATGFAPSGEYDTEMAIADDWADGARLDLLIDAIKAKTDNLPADPADDSDLDTAIAAVNTIATWLKNVGEGDEIIDTTATPWQSVTYLKSTPASELRRKNLYDAAGGNIGSITTVIGQQKEPL